MKKVNASLIAGIIFAVLAAVFLVFGLIGIFR